MNDAESKVLSLFHDAASRVPAYRDFLLKHKLKPSAIKSFDDFSSIPIMDKQNYITQYPLAELCWDGKLDGLTYIVSSSGSTGLPFYWPRGSEQDRTSAALYERVFEASFGLGASSALVVNSYGQGTWIAGTELYNSVRLLGLKHRDISIINPGIDIDLTITQIEKLGPNFDKIIICGYPPLLRDLIEHGNRRGLVWKQHQVYLVTAGEAMSEQWRLYMNRLLGAIENRVINIYGLADAGVVASETPATIAMRAHYPAGLPDSLGGSRTVGLLQFDPMDHYFESDQNQKLLLTTNAGLPLIRYDTKDHGIITLSENLPIMSLFGREDLSATLYAVNIYPENVRPVIDDHQTSLVLTGRFVMQTKTRKDMSQFLDVTVELAPGAIVDAEFRHNLKRKIVDELIRTNSEYRELHAKIKTKAQPRLRFARYNSIGYITGKKHRWVKHD